MAVKSQIDISVNSAEFTALKAAFDKYETALKKMPAAWQNVGQASLAAKTNFESVANNMKVIGGTLATITTNSKEFFQVTTATARHWHNLAISTATVSKNIVGATESLLKWTGIIGIITGGAGLFGFDRLAQSVSSQRTAALGTGGQYGSRAAFLTNFRRFGDPEGLLGRVAQAQTSIKESRALRFLGLSDEDLKGDPADVAIKALRGAARIASQDKTSGMPVGSDPRLRLFTNDERVRLRDHPEEIEEMVTRMRADQKSGRLNLSPADQKGYQDFTTRMEKASREIETIFVKGLVKLASPLGELSDATVKLVDKFTEKALPAFINDLAGAIGWLAKEVEKPAFVEKIESIVTTLGSLATSFGGMLSGLAGFARWLGVATPTNGDFSSGTQPGSGRGGEVSLDEGHPTHGRFTHGHHAHGGHGGHGDAHGATHFTHGHRGGSPATGGATGNVSHAMQVAKDQLRKEGVPEEHLDAAAAALVGNAIAESGLDPTKVHDQGTGYGIYGARLDRRTDMLNWLAAHKFAKDSLEGQQRYMAHEAMTVAKYAASRRALTSATDPNATGDIVEHNFEAPKIDNNRHAAFQKAYGARQRKVIVNSVPGGNTSLGSAAAAAGSP